MGSGGASPRDECGVSASERGLPPVAVAHRALSDRQAFLLAAVTWIGASLARPLPLGVGVGLVVVAFAARRPWVLIVGVAVVAGTMGSRAVDGLAPARPAAYAGVATLVSDPEDRLGATVADVRVEGKRVRAPGDRAPVGAPSAPGWPESGCGSRAGSPAGRRARRGWRSATSSAGWRRGRCGSTVLARAPWRAANRVRRLLDRRRQLAVARAAVALHRPRARRRPRPAGHARRRLPRVRPHPPPRGVGRERRLRAGRGRAGAPTPAARAAVGRHPRCPGVLRARHPRRAVGPARRRDGGSRHHRVRGRTPGSRAAAPRAGRVRSGADRPSAGAVGRLPALRRRLGRHPRDRAGAAAQRSAGRRWWSSRSRSLPAHSSRSRRSSSRRSVACPWRRSRRTCWPARRPGSSWRGVWSGASRPGWRAARLAHLLHLPTGLLIAWIAEVARRASAAPLGEVSAVHLAGIGVAAAVGVLAGAHRVRRVPSGDGRRSCSSIALLPWMGAARSAVGTPRGHAGRDAVAGRWGHGARARRGAIGRAPARGAAAGRRATGRPGRAAR